MTTYHVIFKGHVQGVGFRAHVKSCCDVFNVPGTVRNKTNLDVEAYFQTNEKTFQALIDRIQRTAHRFVKINAIDWEIVNDETNYTTFKIIH
ncbi:acylphosphatase [Dolosicoccus paucivorans]|uniref:acylphosphatase n=1 Tax=Dolosicoccus paucivorans TaxID=84521 RepID=UPI0008884E18|nr:acylphosphatase [Dolosicoccus paucivorans]SDI92677.1 acylphosphatase [Dolosicoccus paucivorans]